jgi:hypothetical protein
MCEAAAFDGVALSPGVIDRLGTGGVRVKQCRWRYGDAPRTPFPPHKALAGKFTTVTGHAGGGFDGFSGYHPGDHKGCLCSLVPVFCAAPGAPLTAAAVDMVDECGPPTLANMKPQFTKAEIDELISGSDLTHGIGDEKLALIYKRNGFDGLPRVLSEADFEDYLRDNPGALDAWRGVKEEVQARAFLEGRYYAGQGVYGNGTYSAYGEGGSLVAGEFAGFEGANVMRFTMAADAHVVDYGLVQDITATYPHLLRERANMAGHIRDALAEGLDPLADDFYGPRIIKAQERAWKLENELRQMLDTDFVDPVPDGLGPDEYHRLAQVLNEEGRIAALFEIDAYNVTGNEYLIVQNRAKVVASEQLRTQSEVVPFL